MSQSSNRKDRAYPEGASGYGQSDASGWGDVSEDHRVPGRPRTAGIQRPECHELEDGGHQDWLKEQERLEDMKAKREFAIQIASENEGSKIHEAALHLAASQIYEVICDFDLQKLRTC